MAVLALAVFFIWGSDLDGIGPFLASFLIGGHCSRISSATVGGSGRNPTGHNPSRTCFARSRQWAAPSITSEMPQAAGLLLRAP